MDLTAVAGRFFDRLLQSYVKGGGRPVQLVQYGAEKSLAGRWDVQLEILVLVAASRDPKVIHDAADSMAEAILKADIIEFTLPPVTMKIADLSTNVNRITGLALRSVIDPAAKNIIRFDVLGRSRAMDLPGGLFGTKRDNPQS